MKNKDLINDRFIEAFMYLLESNRIKTKKEFADLAGINSPKLSEILKKRMRAGIELYQVLFDHFSVRYKFIFKGELPMLNSECENAHLNVHPSVHLTEAKEHIEEYKSKRFQAPTVVTVDNGGQENIVMLDAKAAAGFPANLDNPQYFKDQPTMSIPTHHFKDGSFIALQTTGDSMHPTLYNHDWLFCKYLEDPVNNIREGYIHVLLTKEGVVVKRLLNRIQERGTVVCQSDNEQYPSYEEKLDNILQIWKVEAKLSFILRNESADLNSRINTLEGDMVEIKRLLKR